MQGRFGVLVVVALAGLTAACGSSNNSPTMPTPGGSGGGGGMTSSVSIVRGASELTATAYAPNPVSVAAGSTVTWINNDSTAHTSTSDNGAWNSGSIGPGASFSRTFASAGTFTYHCSIHPGMIGTITVQ